MAKHHSQRDEIIYLFEQGSIPPDKIEAALRRTKVLPNISAWWQFIDHLFLWLGALSLTFSMLFFIAFNWDEIGRFAKFGLLELSIVLAVMAYYRFDKNGLAGKISLLAATILLGVLLAFFGQTYQTGADPWQLFFYWALLMLPWALIGRFPAIWMLWFLLLNLSLLLYHDAFRSRLWFLFDYDSSAFWLAFIFNTVALAVWEILSERWYWLSERWAARTLAVIGGTTITWLTLFDILEIDKVANFSGLAWVIWLATLFFVYRVVKQDLFILAGGCLSGIVVLVFITGRALFDTTGLGDAFANYLLLSILILVLGSGSAKWLNKTHKAWQQ
jgi:uncharacterized membrane protein